MTTIATMTIENNNTFNLNAFPLFERAQTTMIKANQQIELCEKILEAMATISGDTTVTEIQAILNGGDFRYGEYTNQKISAMLKKLVWSDMVKRKVINTGEMIEVKYFDYREGKAKTKLVEKKITLFSLV